MYALTSFREWWSVPDSGSPHTIQGRGVLHVWGDAHYTPT